MNKKKLAAIFLIIAAISAGATFVTLIIMRPLEPYPEAGDLPRDWQLIVSEEVPKMFKDPASVLLRFDHKILHPCKRRIDIKTQGNKSTITTPTLEPGMCAPIYINAKNGFGGYNGEKPYIAFFRNDQFIALVADDSHIIID